MAPWSTTGLVTNLPLADSMVLPRIGTAAFSSRGLLKPDAIRAFAGRFAARA